MVILTFKAPRTSESLISVGQPENKQARDIARLFEGTVRRFPEAKTPRRCEALNIWDDEHD